MAAQLDVAGPSTQRRSSSRLDPLPSSHPLSLRIRSVFDSSSAFINSSKNTADADAEATRAALQEIEERYGQRKSKRKNVKISEENGKSNGKIISVDTEKARKCVAQDAQDGLEKASQSYLDALSVVNASVIEMGSHIGELRLACDDLNTRLGEADHSTRYLLQHANGLRKQHELTVQQSNLLNIFLDRFTLTEKEQETIDSRSIPVGTALFAAMDKINRIRTECQVLLVGQEEGIKAGMRAGMGIMDETSTLLDKAQQKIGKWLLSEMRSFAREGVEVGQHVREAVLRLDGREDLLRPALKTLSGARAQLLSNAFQRALTVGGPAPSYLPRPIELHAHDPMRYVGDMLAWVHQSVASEREFLTAFFSKIGDLRGLEGMRRVGQRRRGLEGSIDWTGDDTAGLPKAELWTRETLDKVIEGCCHSLRIRIEQTVNSQEGCITTYRLASLIQFYRVTMERTMGTRAALSRTLKALSIMTYRAFLSTLERLGAGLARFHDLPEADLSPPAPVLGASATLKELLSAHQASLSEADMFGDALPLKDLPPDESRDFGLVLSRLIEPIMDVCARMGDALLNASRGRGNEVEEKAQWKRDIFLINCLNYVKSVIEFHHFAARSVGRIEEDLDQHVEELIKRHYTQLSIESGLDSIGRAVEDEGQKKVEVDSDLIKRSLDKFEEFLGSPTLISSTHLDLLDAPTTRTIVHSRALELVARDYERIEEYLKPLTNESINLRHASQVRLLFGVESRS